ncbi:hypothetical protein [Dyadobacter frigoris]|uniref:Lipoprotein n=1 Tax=Dyadobacter frigoris TaxID=2576211 RepID=A0A4U6D400_9BACT|nr:hypothetical protein [Dyadobacter frigoris]TKT92020.1 hypothetical protein FDK13_12855 [Dyadobacter frigoris]GLU53099.1 hypothetical protein Dfri01_25600 [Dyadobacter frigoris]
MKKYYYLFSLLALLACNKKNGSGESGGDSAVEISEVRKVVKPEAVSSYSEPVKDKDGLNDWKFAVSLFETDQTFKYKIKVKYKELEAEDDLIVPNLGIQPKVEVQKGKEPLTCVIGFMDKENVFKEFKRVEVIGDELKIRQTRSYSLR